MSQIDPKLQQSIDQFLDLSPDIEKFRMWINFLEEALYSGSISFDFTKDQIGISMPAKEVREKIEQDFSFKLEDIMNYNRGFSLAIFLLYMVPPEIQENYPIEVEERIEILREADSKHFIFQRNLAAARSKLLPKFIRLTAENYVRTTELISMEDEDEKNYFLQPTIIARIIIQDPEGHLAKILFSMNRTDIEEIIRVLSTQLKINEKLYQSQGKLEEVIPNE